MQTTKNVTVATLSEISCDRCKKTADVEDLEAQEYLTVAFCGGYTSIFGDGSKVQIDLCQDCVKATLGAFLRVTPP